MIKMNVIVQLIILTISYGISTIHAGAEVPKGEGCLVMPGPVGCMYHGYLNLCGQQDVDVNSLPCECLSLFFDGIFIDDTHAIHYRCSANDENYLKDLICTSKPVFLSIGHTMEFSWDMVLNDPNGDILNGEIQSIGTYLKSMGVTGAVLKNVFETGNANPENLSNKLMKYMTCMKDNFPYFTYGLEIDAKLIINQANLPNTGYLDFDVLCVAFDFFKITFDDFNDCTKDYLNGIVPVDGKQGNTLTKLANILSTAAVPEYQLYYAIQLSPQVNNHKGPGCSPNYSEKCKKCLSTEYPNYCIDTSETLYEKGKFINDNAAGFIGVNVDSIDGGCYCHCSSQFPAFQFILNGYNGDCKLTCTIFDEPYTN